jgi:hypothetical protein
MLGLLPALMLSGCNIKPRATGTPHELAILIDSELEAQIGDALRSTFCPIIETPQPEYRLKPIIADYSGLAQVQTQRFLLVVGTLQKSDGVSGLIEKMLSPEVKDGVQNGIYYVFQKENEWARYQLMLILVTPDAQELRRKLEEEGADLYKIFDEKRTEIVMDELYHKLERKDLERDISRRYQFTLRIPPDFELVRDEVEDGWLRLKRVLPTRFVTIWRSPPLVENPIDSAWVIDTWNMLGMQFEDPSRVNPDFTRIISTVVGYYPALKFHGIWETNSSLGGGPFVGYAFYDEDQQRAYFLDGEVFNPGGDKEPYIKQLEVMLETFEIPAPGSRY